MQTSRIIRLVGLLGVLAIISVIVLAIFLNRFPAPPRDEADAKDASVAPPPVRLEPGTHEYEGAPQWGECEEREADRALVIDLTIEGLFKSKRRVLAFKQWRPRYVTTVHEDGTMTGVVEGGPFMSFVGENADGVSRSGRGCGYGGCVRATRIDEHGVNVQIDYSWTTYEDVKGEVKAEFAVLFGQTVDEQLAQGVKVHAFWRKPWHAPTVEDIPFLIRELTGPDEHLASRYLIELGEQAVPALTAAIDDPDRSFNALQSLGRIASWSEKAMLPVLEAMQSPERDIRYAAVHASLPIPFGEATLALEKAVNDPDERIRRVAKWTLDERAKMVAPKAHQAAHTQEATLSPAP